MTNLPLVTAAEAFKRLNDPELAIIDVRAEAEFEKGHFENTLNIPILSDEHRHQVGLTYKQQGSAQAKDLGHQLVSGDYKAAMINRWSQAIANRPQHQALLFCWRGGLRSKLAQEWLADHGITVMRVEGGYKALRHQALSLLQDPKPFIVLSGMTGSGKTRLLHLLDNVVDIEAIACHRGSAFGRRLDATQPQQATFENRLAQAFACAETGYVLEDESPNIGRCHLPDELYARMAQAPMVMIDDPVELRALAIHAEYIQQPLTDGIAPVALENSFLLNMEKLRNRLGGLECEAIKQMIKTAFALDSQPDQQQAAHAAWIARLLSTYYDKRYLYSLARKSRQTLFKGSWEACLEFLRQQQV